MQVEQSITRSSSCLTCADARIDPRRHCPDQAAAIFAFGTRPQPGSSADIVFGEYALGYALRISEAFNSRSAASEGSTMYSSVAALGRGLDGTMDMKCCVVNRNERV